MPSWGLKGRGDFETIVADQVFGSVQRLLDGRTKALTPHLRNHPDFPLRRFVTCKACATPLTGSWSTGRARKYAYYHCRRCRAVKISKQGLEARFVELLESLQPETAYLRLLKAIILDVWRRQQGELVSLRSSLENRVQDLRRRLQRVEDAFIHERAIDPQTYEAQRDKLRDQVTLAELELSEARTELLDVDGILGFAEYVLTRARRLWMELELDQKQRLQQVLFPEGLAFDGEGFGTVITCLAFKKLGENGESKSGVASPTGFEPVFWP